MTAVLGQRLAITPGIVGDRHHVILQKAHRLLASDQGQVSFRIAQLQRRVVLEHLVDALGPQAGEVTDHFLPRDDEITRQGEGVLAQQRQEDLP